MNTNLNSNLLILTYNVCFQAMTNNATGSASNLGCECTYVGPHLTRCAVNMAHCIDAIPERMNMDNFDFVGLQEASNWGALRHAAPRTLQAMKVIHSESGPEEMASFYNSQKYKLVHNENSKFSDGRPFQILICASKLGEQGVIFVNIHAPHHYTFEKLSEKIGSTLSEMNLSTSEAKYRIIVTGDFNETGRPNSNILEQTVWTPFKSAGIPTPVKIQKKQFGTPAVQMPPLSCCNDGKWIGVKGHGTGDYIFDSATVAETIVPPNYDPNLYQSDHLPVIALLA